MFGRNRGSLKSCFIIKLFLEKNLYKNIKSTGNTACNFNDEMKKISGDLTQNFPLFSRFSFNSNQWNGFFMIGTSVMKVLNISKNLQFFEEYFIEKYSSGKLKKSIKLFSISFFPRGN